MTAVFRWLASNDASTTTTRGFHLYSARRHASKRICCLYRRRRPSLVRLPHGFTLTSSSTRPSPAVRPPVDICIGFPLDDRSGLRRRPTHSPLDPCVRLEVYALRACAPYHRRGEFDAEKSRLPSSLASPLTSILDLDLSSPRCSRRPSSRSLLSRPSPSPRPSPESASTSSSPPPTPRPRRRPRSRSRRSATATCTPTLVRSAFLSLSFPRSLTLSLSHSQVQGQVREGGPRQGRCVLPSSLSFRHQCSPLRT
jgi:hypothetical protein